MPRLGHYGTAGFKSGPRFREQKSQYDDAVGPRLGDGDPRSIPNSSRAGFRSSTPRGGTTSRGGRGDPRDFLDLPGVGDTERLRGGTAAFRSTGDRFQSARSAAVASSNSRDDANVGGMAAEVSKVGNRGKYTAAFKGTGRGYRPVGAGKCETADADFYMPAGLAERVLARGGGKVMAGNSTPRFASAAGATTNVEAHDLPSFTDELRRSGKKSGFVSRGPRFQDPTVPKTATNDADFFALPGMGYDSGGPVRPSAAFRSGDRFKQRPGEASATARCEPYEAKGMAATRVPGPRFLKGSPRFRSEPPPESAAVEAYVPAPLGTRTKSPATAVLRSSAPRMPRERKQESACAGSYDPPTFVDMILRR